MSHPRVVNVRHRGARWDVYVGRGRCPRTGEGGAWGNPFSVEEHGRSGPGNALLRYVDRLGQIQAETPDLFTEYRALAGKILGCWCAPGMCHGEVLARLADGEGLDAIRARIERATVAPAAQPELFAAAPLGGLPHAPDVAPAPSGSETP